LKAAGMSVLRVMLPILIASFFISVGTFFVINNLVPVSYNEIFTLRDDIGKTKDEIKIPSGTFYDGVDGYVLRVGSRNDRTGMMKDVMLYDHHGKGNTRLTLADSAIMKMSKDKSYLTFRMYHGANYQEDRLHEAGNGHRAPELCFPEIRQRKVRRSGEGPASGEAPDAERLP
ncbi:MAG: LptF/LptG family permease, partial [Bacteroidales bacterium]|nr:LptF/LptG family permease [Bacteroidales bacterium]